MSTTERGRIPLTGSRDSRGSFLRVSNFSSLRDEEHLRREAAEALSACLLPIDGTTRDHLQIDTARVRQEASEIDLSTELQLLAQVEHAVYEVQKEARGALSAMPSCGQDYFASRPSSELIRLLTEVNQHLFQCAQFQEDIDIRLPNMRNDLHDFASRHAIVLPRCMGEFCSMDFVSSIALAVAMGVVIRLGKTDYVLQHRRMQLLRCNRPDLKRFWEIHSNGLSEFNVAAAKAEGDRLRIEFLDKAQLKRPTVVRVIDCKATCEEKQVVLLDWEDSRVQEAGYSAISHTYGQEVYSVFNCECATLCLAKEPRCDVNKRCPHGHAASDDKSMRQREVMQDVKTMCAILQEAGVGFAWHDGVCIAQHKGSEVTNTIGHIGWVYSNANDTIIFLHYIGKPMAPIKLSRVEDEMTSRWHTRVWTLQEAALSKCRRYCVRVCSTTPLRDCESLEDFEMKLSRWYDDEFSRVEVIDEESFFEIVKSIALFLNSQRDAEEDIRTQVWADNVIGLVETLKRICFRFPAIDEALRHCAQRDSKHKGDRINSILTLAKVTGFVAPKDEKVEESTLKFFRKQGEEGLALALFTTNNQLRFDSDFIARGHTWLPVLSESLLVATSFHTSQLQNGPRFTVVGDGKLQVSGTLVGIKVRFTLKRSLPTDREEHSAAAQERCIASYVQDERYGLGSIGHDHVLNMQIKCHENLILVSLSEDPVLPVATLRLPFLVSFLHESPTLDGRHLLQHEESFLAYLVLLSDLGLEQPLLVVQGETLDGEVSQLGLLCPDNTFPLRWLVWLRNLDASGDPCLTNFTKLIIK